MQFFVGLFIVISGRPGWDFENLGGDGRAQEESEGKGKGIERIVALWELVASILRRLQSRRRAWDSRESYFILPSCFFLWWSATVDERRVWRLT